MSISYPLQMPASPRGIELGYEKSAAISASPFTASEEIFEWPGERWTAKVTVPPCKRDDAEKWIAFLAALRGRVGTFAFGDPAGKTARGKAATAPSAAGQDDGFSVVGSKKLALSFLNALGGISLGDAILKAGDYVQTCANYLQNGRALDLSPWANNSSGAANPTVTANAQVAPDVTTTAESIAFAATSAGQWSGRVQIPSGISSLIGQRFYFSIWLKAAAPVSIEMILERNGDFAASHLTANVTTSWQRFVTPAFIPDGSAGETALAVHLRNNPSQSAKTIYAWGAALYSDTLDAHLYKALADVIVGNAGYGTSDTSNANVDIFPVLRATPGLDTPLIVTNPVGTFRLATNKQVWSIDTAKIYGIEFDAVEAV